MAISIPHPLCFWMLVIFITSLPLYQGVGKSKTNVDVQSTRGFLGDFQHLSIWISNTVRYWNLYVTAYFTLLLLTFWALIERISWMLKCSLDIKCTCQIHVFRKTAVSTWPSCYFRIRSGGYNHWVVFRILKILNYFKDYGNNLSSMTLTKPIASGNSDAR